MGAGDDRDPRNDRPVKGSLDEREPLRAAWPDPVELRLGGTSGQLRVRVRAVGGVAMVVIERVLSQGGRYTLSPALELPAHRCAALGEILLRFAAAIPDRAP